jgi:exonuclease VII small subunit
MLNDSQRQELQELEKIVDLKFNDIKTKNDEKFRTINEILESYFYKLSEKISTILENQMQTLNVQFVQEIKEIHCLVEKLEKDESELDQFLLDVESFLKK